MASRLELQTLLETILGSSNVYFQPPPSIQIKYPAIRYVRSGIDNLLADDDTYLQDYSYDITVIDRDPDSEIVRAVSRLPFCKFIRHYAADNLNHDVFKLYF